MLSIGIKWLNLCVIPLAKIIMLDIKKIGDDYFYLKHRNEPRGVGGLFLMT